MLELHPESMNTRNRDGYLLVHKAACGTEKENADIISFLLLKDPHSASKATNGQERDLPMHLACERVTVNRNAVKLLFDACLDAIYTINGLGGSNSEAIGFLRKQVAYAQ